MLCYIKDVICTVRVAFHKEKCFFPIFQTKIGFLSNAFHFSPPSVRAISICHSYLSNIHQG